MTRVSNNKSGKRITVSPSTKGAINEHIATAWLMASGYDVFRNVSPNGRADLLAVDWQNDETIRVDVKSQGYDTTKEVARLADASATREANMGFDIKYLIVDNDGTCRWYSEEEPESANDNEPPLPEWFVDTKTGQRFRTPGNDMSRKEWAYFCHWLVRAYPDFIVPFSESFVRSISARGIGTDRIEINEKEFSTLEKLRKHIFQKLKDARTAALIPEDAA